MLLPGEVQVRAAWVGTVAAVVAVAAVVVVAAPLAGWLLGRLGDGEALAGLGCQLAAVVVAMVVWQRPPDAPAPARGSLAMAGLLLIGGVVVDLRIVQMAGVFCLAHAAVAVVAPGRVTALVPVLLLLLLGLPLAGDLDVLGFPARLLAAHTAQGVLGLAGADVVGAETVLVVEGNVADVEAPCAGLATLRVLALVVTIAGALRGAAPGRLLGAMLSAAVVAVAGNALRVSALAALVLVLQRSDLARLVHVPLGVLVFGAAVATADVILRWPWGPQRDRSKTTHSSSTRPVRLADSGALLAIAVVTTLVRLTLVPEPSLPVRASLVRQPAPDALALSSAEQGLFGRHAWFAEKRAVDGGSVLIVVATSLRAHHAPERCLAGSGLRIDAATTTIIAGIPVKRLLLDGGQRLGISFFVHDDDGVSRVRASLWERAAESLLGGPAARQQPWAFVSAVVDASTDVNVLVPALLLSAQARLRESPSESR